MKRLFPSALGVMLLWLAGLGPAQRLAAQPSPPDAPAAPAVPAFRPPTEFFRGLLRMSPDELGRLLTNKTPELRGRLDAKMKEYRAMPPEAREARLHATELHEYLEHFVTTPGTNRNAQLASVPAEYRNEVADRLTKFDLLPPPLKQEALATEATAGYFVGPPVPVQRSMAPVPPPLPPDPLGALRTLSASERDELFASFDHFFDLSDQERQQVIMAIPAGERPQVSRTLAQIEQLPREQRERSLRVLGKLAEMTGQQRQLFFNSVERWNAMSPAERDTWLKVVSHLPPPLPPPSPPHSSIMPGGSGAALSAATNPGN